MAAAKTKQYLVVDPDGCWAAGPYQAGSALQAIIDSESGDLGTDQVGNTYDVYEVVNGPTKLKTVVAVATRD